MLARMVLLIFFIPEWIVTLWVFRSPHVRRWRVQRHPAQGIVIGLVGVSVVIAIIGVRVTNTFMGGAHPLDRGLMRMFNAQHFALACTTLWMMRTWREPRTPENRVARQAASRRLLVRVVVVTSMFGAAVAVSRGPNVLQMPPRNWAELIGAGAIVVLLLVILLIMDVREKRKHS